MDVTYNFTAGTRAVAQQVNQNFADVKSAVDTVESDISTIQDDITDLQTGVVQADGSVDSTRLQSYKTYTVSNATNASPIVITAVGHGFLTGDKVYTSGIGGNTAANGVFTITKISDDTFSLDDSVGNDTFTTNGTVVIYPSADKNLVHKRYVDRNTIGTCSTANYTALTGTFKTQLTGTFTATNGSATVTGSGSLLTTEVVAGDTVTIAGVRYTVLSVSSATSMTLTTTYSGTTASSLVLGTQYIVGNGSLLTTELSVGQYVKIGDYEYLISSITSNTLMKISQSSLTNGTTLTLNKVLNEKVVILEGFELIKGATIQVIFTNANTATTPTLNVNSTGAISVASEDGTVCSETNPFYVPANAAVEFTYNGTYWVYKNRIVSSYVNGTSWYQQYADGKIRQGGYISATGSLQNSVTISLMKEYKNTNYNIQITYKQVNGQSANISFRESGYSFAYTSYFIMGIQSTAYSIGANWLTEGY